MKNPLRIAHRGARAYALENTLLAFQKALDLGCDAIELDIQLSKDNALVVIHDDTVNRTTNATGLVKELTLLELQQLGIPSLQNVLDFVATRCIINIEIKANHVFETLNKTIKNAIKNGWKYEQLIVSCFNHDALRYMHKLNTNIYIGVLTETSIAEALETAKELNAYAVHPDYVLLDKTSCEAIQQAGFKVFTWTVNDPEAIQNMKKIGVDGIMSDYLDRI